MVEYSNLTNSTEYSSIEKVIVENGDCLYIFYVGNSCLTDGLMFQCSPDLSSPAYFLRDKSPTQLNKFKLHVLISMANHVLLKVLVN